MSGMSHLWKFKPWHWMLAIAVIGLLAYIFFDSLFDEVKGIVPYWGREEYSHGYMLPLVAAFFVWQRSTLLYLTPFPGSWLGIVLAMLGFVFYITGELATVYTVIQYGLLIFIGGILLSFLGLKAFRIILPAYLLLFFVIPLPPFIYNGLSSWLQLISSQFGVSVIRWFGITVFLEGNVIDLGNYQLQVVEACNGLRYLFPLSALGFIAAVLFKGAFWKKVVLFMSTLPITVLMNSFRIGVIGILVNYGGAGMAEGFIHDFEGWVVFMACAALLVLEMWFLAKLGRNPLPLRDAFAIEGPDPVPPSAEIVYRRLPLPFYGVLSILLAMLLIAQLLPQREEVVLDRPEFLFFPRDIGDWHGRTDRLEKIYLDSLKLDDYLLADYVNGKRESVNLYVAYYEAQRKGVSVHSPKSCLPGGGWRIQEFSQPEIPDARVGDQPLRVNRSLIQMGDERLLVYYWFQQRGRVMTNEYLVKWYLFWDALTRNRTDGALVRLTTSVPFGSDLAAKDALLSDFARVIEGPLRRFVPE